jgi:hypothetical protein
MSRLKRERQMRASYKLISVLFAVALLGAPAEAQQLAKSGNYVAKIGFSSAGQAYELEKGHAFWVGVFHGVFFNDAGGGFLHNTLVTCPAANDIVNGASVAVHGYCIMTDKDGDRAFLVYHGKGVPSGSLGGTFEWTGGTGKYAGLQGNNTWHNSLFIGDSGSGSVVWEGEWRLP